jgi:hypothetical protein
MYRVAHRRSEHDLYGELAQMSGGYGLREAFIRMTRSYPRVSTTRLIAQRWNEGISTGSVPLLRRAAGREQALADG